MSRAAKWAAGLVAFLVALMLVAGVGGNTGPGRRVIEAALRRFAGVEVQGLAGRFPDQLRAARVGLLDRDGAWLTLDHVAIDWSPLDLLRDELRIEAASAGALDMPRLPVPDGASSGGDGGLPFRIKIGGLHIARASLGAWATGVPVVVGLDGAGFYRSLADMNARVALRRLDAPGTYNLNGYVAKGAMQGRFTGHEPAGGLLSGLAGLPELGPVSLEASLAGPMAAVRARFLLAAGGLRAHAEGGLDWPARSGTLDLVGSSGTMVPRADLAWRALDITAHYAGRFAAPKISAALSVQGLAAAGAVMPDLTVDVSGDQGHIDGRARVSRGFRLPGQGGDVFADDPLVLAGSMSLMTPGRPLKFGLSGKLVQARGSFVDTGQPSGRLTINLPDLRPVGAMAKLDLRGRTQASLWLQGGPGGTDFGMAGSAQIDGALALSGLLGATRYSLAARMVGDKVILTRADVAGRDLSVQASGTDGLANLELAWKLTVPDLAALGQGAVGDLHASGRLYGPHALLSAAADIQGDMGGAHFARSPLDLAVS